MGPWAWFRYIFGKKSFQLQQRMSNAQRLDQGSSWASICRSRFVAQLALSQLQNPAYSLALFAVCIVEWSIARGRSFYNAAVTWYKSDIPHLLGGYALPLLWLHTPQLRLGVTTVAGCIYPLSRCGISYTYIYNMHAWLKYVLVTVHRLMTWQPNRSLQSYGDQHWHLIRWSQLPFLG